MLWNVVLLDSSNNTYFMKRILILLLLSTLICICFSDDGHAQTKGAYPKSLVGRVYKGTVNTPYNQYVTTTFEVKFQSSTKLTCTMTMRVKEGQNVEEVIRMWGGSSTDPFAPKVMQNTYTYKNGIVRISGSTDKLTLKKGNKILYWYASDNFNGDLYLQK